MYLLEKTKRLYSSSTALSHKEYYDSRQFFIMEGSTYMGIFALTTGAFLAGYANYLGADDQFNGIIGAVPALMGGVQILAPLIFERMKSRKLLVCILTVLHRMMFGGIFFIPLLVKGTQFQLMMLAGLYGLAYLAAAFVTPAISNWIVDLTPVHLRGKYFAQKDVWSLTSFMIISLVMGGILDLFRKGNQEYTGFIINGIVVIALALANFIVLSRVGEVEVAHNTVSPTLRDIVIKPIKKASFRKIIMLSVIWNIGFQVAAPFFAVYTVTGLKLDYTYIMIISLISNLGRVLIIPFWGRLADKHSWCFTTKASISILAITHLLWFFINSATVSILYPLLSIIGGVAWAGIGMSMFNIQFDYCPKEGRTMYLATNAAIGGIAGFASTLAGSFVVKTMEGITKNIFAFSFSGMQTLFALSGILLGFCVLFIHLQIRGDREI